MSDLEIILRKQLFTSGDTIEGQLHFKNKKHLDHNGIFVTLECTEETRVRKMYGTKQVPYAEKREILADSLEIVPTGSLSSGEHKFDFSINLPEMAPSSYTGIGADIKYKLKTKVELSRARDKSTEIPIIVNCPIGPISNESRTLLLEKDEVRFLEIEMPSEKQILGEELPFKVWINRDAKFKGVKAELIHREFARAKGHQNERTKTLSKAYINENKVPRNDWFDMVLTTSPDMPSTFDTELITCQMEVRVSLDRRWHLDESLDMIVILGYRPLKDDTI